MKQWKKTSVASVVLMSTFASGLYAEEVFNEVKAYLRPDMSIVYNGEKTSLSQPVLIYNNSSYLPVKAVSELLGASVQWDEASLSIHISKDEFPVTEPSTGAAGNSAHEPPPGSVYSAEDVELEIVLQDVIPYKFTYEGKDYGVLANFYNNTMYLRLSDIQRMGINTLGLKYSLEQMTDEPYLHISEVEKRWTTTPQTDLMREVIIEDETDPDKIKALKTFLSNNAGSDLNSNSGSVSYTPPNSSVALSVQKDPSEENKYKFLVKTAESEFMIYTVTLRENSSTSTPYTIDSRRGAYLTVPE